MKIKILNRISKGLEDILNKDKKVFLFGEDIKDPYGGAFKVTAGLSKKFPKQIIQTPISEAGFVGIATGITLKSNNVIVEIMFNDFLTLITDILINTASKLPELKGKNNNLGKILIRTPGGGGRGYGPIHSQNLEKIFFGWPNIEVIAPNIILDPYETLISAYESKSTIKIFLENKLDYSKNILSKEELTNLGFNLKLISGGLKTSIVYNSEDDQLSDFFLLSYGGLTEKLIKASTKLLLEHELTSTIIIPSQISPLNEETLEYLSLINKNIFTMEDGYSDAGWGSYVTSCLTKKNNFLKLNQIKIIGPKNKIIPANIVKEKDHFIQVEDIFEIVKNKLLND